MRAHGGGRLVERRVLEPVDSARADGGVDGALGLVSRAMIIAQISDTHIDPEDPNGARRLCDLEQVVVDINGLDPRPDAVVHTGDLAHNGNEVKYRAAKAILARLRCPFFPVAGNRDEPDLLRGFFSTGRDLRPGTPFFQYAAEDFPVRLLILDSRHRESNQGEFCALREDILTAALDDTPNRPTALFLHHPPFEVVESKYPWQFEERASVDRLDRILRGRDSVVRLFCGHAHRDARGTVGGVPAGTVPSVAVDLRLGDFGDEVGKAPVYQLHRFDGATFTTELRATRALAEVAVGAELADLAARDQRAVT